MLEAISKAAKQAMMRCGRPDPINLRPTLSFEQLCPLPGALIIVWGRNSESSISKFIQHSEDTCACPCTVAMILNEDVAVRDPR